MVDDIPITDTLKHIADDHPCCAGSLMQAVARIEELEKRVQSARPFVEAAAEEAVTGPGWAEEAREWLGQGG